MEDDTEFEQALYRFSLISPLLHLEDDEDRKRTLKSIVSRELEIPNSKKKKITDKTLQNYLRRYERDGFGGLKRQARNDKNKLKTVSAELLGLIHKLKKEEPRRSARQLIRIIKSLPEYEKCQLKERTISRILKNSGLTRRDLLPKKIYKSFEMEHINDLWQTDASEGLFLKGANRKTQIIAFIDDFSRIIPHAWGVQCD